MQIKTANGKQILAMTRDEWGRIGKAAGWTKTAKRDWGVALIEEMNRGIVDDAKVKRFLLFPEWVYEEARSEGILDGALRNIRTFLRTENPELWKAVEKRLDIW